MNIIIFSSLSFFLAIIFSSIKLKRPFIASNFFKKRELVFLFHESKKGFRELTLIFGSIAFSLSFLDFIGYEFNLPPFSWLSNLIAKISSVWSFILGVISVQVDEYITDAISLMFLLCAILLRASWLKLPSLNRLTHSSQSIVFWAPIALVWLLSIISFQSSELPEATMLVTALSLSSLATILLAFKNVVQFIFKLTISNMFGKSAIYIALLFPTYFFTLSFVLWIQPIFAEYLYDNFSFEFRVSIEISAMIVAIPMIFQMYAVMCSIWYPRVFVLYSVVLILVFLGDVIYAGLIEIANNLFKGIG